MTLPALRPALAFALTAVFAPAIAAPAPACALLTVPSTDRGMQVPFDVIDGRIYVQARVDGRGPFRFAVDTGASGMGRADASLVTALGLEILKPVANSDGVSTSEADTTRLASLDVGGLVRRDLTVITRDYNSRMSAEAAFSGIVAREFFADGLLVIDYPKKTLSFSRTRAIDPDAPDALAYERPFRVPVSIGALRTEGNLDTGANTTFVMPQALFDRVGASSTRPAGEGALSNTAVATQGATVHGPFRIGDAQWSDVDVRVAAKYPELLVGAHALQSYVVMIDQRSKRVALCR